MSLNLEQKMAAVDEIRQRVAQAQAIVLAEYRSLEVGEMTQLRARARNAGVYLRVFKNTLARRAVADTPFSGLADQMVGPLAYGISIDPVSAAKVLHEFARGNDKFVIKAGATAGHVMTAQEVVSLASLPSRELLLAQLLGTLQAPIAHLARLLNEVPARFARTLAAIRDQREPGQAPAD